MELFCPWEPAKYLFFSSNVPNILYYALIPGMITSLLFSLLIFIKNKKNLAVRSLLYLSLLFCVWGFFALILFATNNTNQVMFFWSLTILIEPSIYLLGLIFTYYFITNNKVLGFNRFFLIILPILPIIILLSTQYNLVGVDLDCNAQEGPVALYYSYLIEIIYSLVILYITWKKYQISEKSEKNKILYFGIGICLLLIVFSSGNIIGSFTDDWILSQYGYFGMPIFIGILAYLTVKYNSFNIKLMAVQALVWGLAILIGSQFFFIKTSINLILNGITFSGVLIFGVYLIKSVKKEVEQREKMERLSEELQNSKINLEQTNKYLENANEKLKSVDKLKTEFLSLASHQLRSPLTAINGYTSMLLDGDFGNLDAKQKETVDKVFESSKHLTRVVEDLLSVTKIEQGGMQFTMAPFDFEKTVSDIVGDMIVVASKKNLKLSFDTDNNIPYTVNGDLEKIRQVIINLVDNSIKYTKEGSISLLLTKDLKKKKVVLAIKDTGMGMTKEIMNTLFQKFARGEGGKVNTGGSGLGLYLAKKIVEAHKGNVWVESPGEGLGSTFFVEFDLS